MSLPELLGWLKIRKSASPDLQHRVNMSWQIFNCHKTSKVHDQVFNSAWIARLAWFQIFPPQICNIGSTCPGRFSTVTKLVRSMIKYSTLPELLGWLDFRFSAPDLQHRVNMSWQIFNCHKTSKVHDQVFNSAWIARLAWFQIFRPRFAT